VSHRTGGDENEAAIAYDESAVALRGSSKAILNFPNLDYGLKGKRILGVQRVYNSKRPGVSRGSSQYLGVTWDRACAKWRAKIKYKAKTRDLGLYHDELEAARAYDVATLNFRGTKAILNFPEEHVHSKSVASGQLKTKILGGNSSTSTDAGPNPIGSDWTPEQDRAILTAAPKKPGDPIHSPQLKRAALRARKSIDDSIERLSVLLEQPFRNASAAQLKTKRNPA